MIDLLRKKEHTTTSMIMIAIIAALGLVGIAAITIVTTIQQAEAFGCADGSQGDIASRGKCSQDRVIVRPPPGGPPMR